MGAADRLAARVGQEAVLFGALDHIKSDGWPHVLYLADRKGQGVPVVVFEGGVWSRLELDAILRRFVTVRGRVTLYEGRPQVVVAQAEQVSARLNEGK